jgi:hypothetical protein
MEHQLLQRLAALRNDQQAMGGPPGKEGLFDRVAPCDQLFFLADKIGRRRTARRASPMSVGLGTGATRPTPPGRSRPGPEWTTVICTRSVGSPRFDRAVEPSLTVGCRALRRGRWNLFRRDGRRRNRQLRRALGKGGIVHLGPGGILEKGLVVARQFPPSLFVSGANSEAGPLGT